MLATALSDLWYGFGVALEPQNLMWCFVGVLVGNMVGVLPGMGPLATISVMNPPNLAIVCVDNGHYGETGWQKSHTSLGVDLEKIAIGSGIKRTMTINQDSELAAGPLPVGVAAAELTACLDALIGNVFAHTPPGTSFSVRLQPRTGGGALGRRDPRGLRPAHAGRVRPPRGGDRDAAGSLVGAAGERLTATRARGPPVLEGS